MKLNKAFKHLFRRLGLFAEEENCMQIPEHLKKMIQMIESTQEIEFSCDEVYQLIDQYTEVVSKGGDSRELMPLVEQHINMCPDCREEFEALLRILQANPI
jgi:predicted transcriptional regulator